MKSHADLIFSGDKGLLWKQASFYFSLSTKINFRSSPLILLGSKGIKKNIRTGKEFNCIPTHKIIHLNGRSSCYQSLFSYPDFYFALWVNKNNDETNFFCNNKTAILPCCHDRLQQITIFWTFYFEILYSKKNQWKQ